MSNLSKVRKSKRIKQKQLAHILGVTPQAISALERTGIKTVRLARKYAVVLKCDPLELLE